VLDVDRADHLLEIGCGRGVAVSLICDRLASGKITAIDQSPTMVRLALRRNAEHVTAGKADIRTMALETADLGGARFDKIFAVNMNLFWVRSPAKQLALIKRLLASGGVLYVFCEPPAAARATALANQLAAVFAQHGFATSTRTATARSSLLAIAARPGNRRRFLVAAQRSES
jgi:trans-aconitate methyltransferase